MYSVTVVTDPPSGPHAIESTVNLTCLVHPQPSGEGVTYRWRDNIAGTSMVVANSSLPYATLTIGIGHPRTARYHCQVYYRGQMLAAGSTVITVQGRLHISIYLHPACMYHVIYHHIYTMHRFAVSNGANFCAV